MSDRQLIADLLSALEYHTEQTRPIEFSKVAVEAAREYLRKSAQRPWQGLTDEEKRQIFEREDYQGWLDYINAIEAKLRSKNT